MHMYEPADIVIYMQDKGIVAKEKSLLAVDTNTNKVIAYGSQAESYATFPKPNVHVLSLMHRGAIIDYMAAVELFSYMIKTVGEKKSLFHRKSVVVCIPKEYSLVDKRAMEDILHQCGIKEIGFTKTTLASYRNELDMRQNTHTPSMVIVITKDEPKQYLKEYVAELIEYAKQECISLETIKVILQEKLEENS